MIISDSLPDFIFAAKRGDLILYPTDSVYGIGCIIKRFDQVQKIKDIKSRSKEQGLIIIAACWSQVEFLIENPIKEILYEDWPNDTTYVFKAKKNAPNELLDHRSSRTSVAIRFPKKDFIRSFLFETGPLISTSANFSGKQPVSKFKDIDPRLLNMIDFAFEYDATNSGIASKIYDYDSKECLRS